MSLHNRHSLNAVRESEGRVSLNAATISDLPEEDFRGAPDEKRALRQEDGDANPLNRSLMSSDGEVMSGRNSSLMSDPSANSSTLLDQSWATKVMFVVVCFMMPASSIFKLDVSYSGLLFFFLSDMER
jgi:hypothetical protein